MLPPFPPELYNRILKELDVKSLRSCILTNRLLCVYSMPILWKNPLDYVFSNDFVMEFSPEIKSIILTYIYCLPKNSFIFHNGILTEEFLSYPLSTKTSDYSPSPSLRHYENWENWVNRSTRCNYHNNINGNYSNSPSFNYASYLCTFDYHQFYQSLNFTFSHGTYSNESRKKIFEELIKLFMDQCRNLTSFKCGLSKFNFSDRFPPNEDFDVDLFALPKFHNFLERLQEFTFSLSCK